VLIDSLSNDWSLCLLVLSISAFLCDYLYALSLRFLGITSAILIMNPSTWIGLDSVLFLDVVIDYGNKCIVTVFYICYIDCILNSLNMDLSGAIEFG
jgi:hypothetical protein